MKLIIRIIFIMLCCFTISKIEVLPIKDVDDNLSKLKVVSDNAYYFDKDGIVQKVIVVDNNKYLFANHFKEEKYKFAVNQNGDVYCVDEDGVIQTGLIKIDNDSYYFNEQGIMQKGIVDIDGKNYIFNEISGKLQYGFTTMSNGDVYYIDSDGTIKTGFVQIESDKYYFNEQGIMQKGMIEINGQTHIFAEDGKLQYGFVSYNGNTYYTNGDGVIQTGFIDINGGTYYFNSSGILQTGFQTIDGNQYYFGYNGRMVKDTITIGNNEYHFNASGILEYVRKLPVYYSQKDGRWAGTTFGENNMATSGCGPTSLAMIFSSILGRGVSPTEVANYLYNYTNEFNKDNIGMSGLGAVYAASAYGISYHGISSLDELNSELNQGKLVIGYVGSGHFVKEGYTHSIVLFGDSSNVKVYNPNGGRRNTSTNIVWSERSSDPYDYKGGYLFYSFN